MVLPTVTGASKAGIGTGVLVQYNKKLGVLCDCGTLGARPDALASRSGVVLLSHGHLDHIAMLFLHARLRRMLKRPPAVYLAPAEAVEALHAAREAMGQLDGGELEMDLRGVRAGDVVPLGQGVDAVVCATTHRVPSVGYALVRRTQRMRPEVIAMPRPERAKYVAAHRETGEWAEVHEEVDFAYTGDTLADVLDSRSEAGALFRRAKVLCIELTFLRDVPVSLARERGHVHLDEIVAHAAEGAFAACEQLVLVHFSARYSHGQIGDALLKALPRTLLEKISPLWAGFGLENDMADSLVAGCALAAARAASDRRQGGEPLSKRSQVREHESLVAWNALLAVPGKLATADGKPLSCRVAFLTFGACLQQQLWVGCRVRELRNEKLVVIPVELAKGTEHQPVAHLELAEASARAESGQCWRALVLSAADAPEQPGKLIGCMHGVRAVETQLILV